MALFGAIVLRTGTGLLIVNVRAAEVPPPGVGLKTVTNAVPADARFPDGTVAVSEVLEPKVVAKSAPFQRTTELELNPVPVRVIENEPEPATAEFGLSNVSVGTGLVIVKGRLGEIPPPGPDVITVTGTVPGVCKFDDAMEADS